MLSNRLYDQFVDAVKSAGLVLSLTVMIDGKSSRSFCCVGRPTDEEDPRNQVFSKFGRQVVEEEQLERKSSGGDNPRNQEIQV